MRSLWALGVLCAAVPGPPAPDARASGASVEIGVLNDPSGIYADLSGKGSVIAARPLSGGHGLLVK